MLAEADVLLAIDVFDLAGALAAGTSPELNNDEYVGPNTKVININLWDLMQHSLISDYERLHPVDLPIAADSRVAVPMLLEFCRRALERDGSSRGRLDDRSRAIERLQDDFRARREAAGRRGWDAKPLSMERVSHELAAVVKERGLPWTFVGSRGAGWEVTSPE